MVDSTITSIEKVIFVFASHDAAKAHSDSVKGHFPKHQIVYNGSGRASRNFNGIIVFAANNDELVSIREGVLNQFANVPVSAFVSAEELDVAFFDSERYADLEGAIVALNEKHNKVLELVQAVFKTFDADNSGFIDRGELKAASEQLGAQMNENDINNMMLDLDRNKDGKISLGEFQRWWLAGRNGLTNTMRRLLGLKIRS